MTSLHWWGTPVGYLVAGMAFAVAEIRRRSRARRSEPELDDEPSTGSG